MTRTDGSRGSGSDDKRDQWHMHMTRTDVIRGGGSWFVTAWLVCDAINQPPMSSFSTDSTS